MVPRSARVARNERWLREANERVERASADFVDRGFAREREEVEFFCECGRYECPATIRMTVAEYEEARSGPARYVTVPGHETPAIEHVVETHKRYQVVEKSPKAERIAEEA